MFCVERVGIGVSIFAGDEPDVGFYELEEEVVLCPAL